MDLERISVAVRARDSWEAVDLGFAMVRRWWRAIYSAWIVVVLPPALLLNLAFRDYPWVAFVLLWWLKPLFDRVPLAIVSRAFFGEVPTPWRIVTRPRQYLGRGLLGDLTIRRLSPWRSYLMPVAQLEELSGAARIARAGVFTATHSGMALLLTGICWTFEAFLLRGGFLLILMLLPDTVDPETLFGDLPLGLALPFPELIGLTGEGPAWLPLVRNGFSVAAMALVEPFYVAAGFSLYINRRVDLEGWDIELGFRRMTARLQSLLATTAAVLLVTLSAGIAHTADEPDFQTTMAEVLAHPDFGTTETVERWEPIRDTEPSEFPDLDLAWAGEVGRFLSTILVWTVSGLALALLGYLLVAFLGRGDRSSGDAGRQRTLKPDSLFGLDLRPDSLPTDLLGAARRLWAAGDAAGAMSLLYRGALAHVVDRLRVDVPDSATEGECIELVSTHLEQPVAEDFTTLTHAWQLVAYADRDPSAAAFEDLCQRWRRHLRPAG
jgi:hypothetical protein